MMETGKSRKDIHSGDYVVRYESRPISRIARLVRLMRLSASDDLIDIACGNAMLLEVVSDKIKSYTGVDFSDDFIASAKGRVHRIGATNCEFHCSSIVEFCEKTARRYDVAVALDFSEHITDEDFVAIFSAIRMVLKPGGRLYLHTPNLDFFLERMRNSGLVLKQRPEHIAVRDTSHNVSLLVKSGFDAHLIAATRLSHYNFLKVLHPLRHLPLLGKYFEARVFIECLR